MDKATGGGVHDPVSQAVGSLDPYRVRRKLYEAAME